VGKSRMMLVDVLGGFYNLRKVIKTEVGENASYVVFQAGIKGGFSFVRPLIRGGRITAGPEGFARCLSALTEGGCGDFRLKEIDWQKGYARVTCHNAFEGWAYANRHRVTKGPTCDYTRGLILGFMKVTHHHAATGLEQDMDCVEVSCIATGQRRCEFIVGTRAVIRSLGLPGSAPRQSIRQQLRERVNENTREIQETKRFFQRILKNAPVGILTIDSEGIVTSANRAIARMFGTQPRRLIGMPAIGPNAAVPSGLTTHLERGLEGKHVLVTDHPLDGRQRRFVRITGIPFKDIGGRAKGCLYIIGDTTQRTLSARRIEYLKNYNESVIHSMIEGIMVVDPVLKIKIWNLGMERIFGIKAKKILGKKLQEIGRSLVSPAPLTQWVEDVLQTGQPIEKRGVLYSTQARGGIILNLKILPFLAQDASDSGIIVLHEDVTDSERSEVRYKNLFETAQDDICLTDPDGRVVSANTRMLKALEARWEEVQGVLLEHFLPADQRSLFKEIVAQGRDVEPYEVEIIGASGKRIPVEMSITAIRRADKIFGFHIISRDISRRKQMETEMIQAGKLAAVGELASCVAHEINNPIASVAGYAEEMLDLIHERGHLSAQDLKEFEEDLAIIIEQAHRCKKITEGLLSFARQGDLDLIHTSINEVIENTILLIEPQIRYAKLSIFKDLQPDLPSTKTSPAQLQQVFLNILMNALEAVGSGGLIRVISRSDNGTIRISFQDTGPGISTEHMEKIFTPFFTTKLAGKGTGLGLSICYRIMEKLKGAIEVESQMGSGATFTVCVPEKWQDTTGMEESVRLT
jgi:PAS domain S-box-containing protein